MADQAGMVDCHMVHICLGILPTLKQDCYTGSWQGTVIGSAVSKAKGSTVVSSSYYLPLWKSCGNRYAFSQYPLSYHTLTGYVHLGILVLQKVEEHFCHGYFRVTILKHHLTMGGFCDLIQSSLCVLLCLQLASLLGMDCCDFQVYQHLHQPTWYWCNHFGFLPHKGEFSV